ncbi:unnamed protein product [Acanthoscelides obtectus]|uniref:Protein zwilch n=1 Tax=Acanthoscelides obtectus TaxID=200917 RepID=A0A9P0NWB4_ACAOB|nr:unnamed protein product [Acanthoscelides obtectus]CAK1661996.1 Protein zwilch [Acanthoscelides obtectus]
MPINESSVCDENSIEYELRSTTMLSPSYLKEILHQEQLQVLLVYLYNKTDDIIKIETHSNNIRVKIEENSTRSDVTGSPLKVDLKGDDSFGTCLKLKYYHPWTDSEAKYHPLSVEASREFMRNYLKKSNITEIPIFAICDGNNSLKTVILGMHKTKDYLITSTLNMLGFKHIEDFTLEKMEKCHYLNSRAKQSNILYSIISKYTIYGSFLQNVKNVNDCDQYGNVTVEIKNNNQCGFNKYERSSEQKVLLQLLAGHHESSVHFLWKQLLILQQYIDILLDPDKYQDHETPLSNSQLDLQDICFQIKELTTDVCKYEHQGGFILQNIRNMTFMDQIWEILKQCENLCMLRESLTYLFETLAESNLTIPITERCSLAILVTGLLEGKLGVPVLRYPQAMEFLFELGAEKLKNDYEAIIRNFCALSNNALFAEWNDLHSQLNFQENFQKVRNTIYSKSEVGDLRKHIAKLAFLSRLHIAVEMIYLLKNESGMTEDVLVDAYKTICKTYSDSKIITDFTDLLAVPLCEISLSVSSVEHCIKNTLPTSWQVQMVSKIKNTEFMTTFHLTKHQIFPFLDIDNDINTYTENFYYVYNYVQDKDIIQ